MSKSSVFLIAQKPILNPEKVKGIENLNIHYSVYLNLLLYQNWIEIFSSLKEKFDYYFVLNENDEDFIPKNFIPAEGNLILIKNGTKVFLQTIVKEVRQINYAKGIFIFYNSIGITKENIIKISDLLSMDDKAVVIGKTVKEQVAFLGTNTSDEKVLRIFFSEHTNYTRLLNKLSKEDIFIQTIDNFLSINNFNDVKKLYIELSKKESLSFCSENMQERFNDLFIEYKELLNE
jgi:hypothetical protein